VAEGSLKGARGLNASRAGSLRASEKAQDFENLRATPCCLCGPPPKRKVCSCSFYPTSTTNFRDKHIGRDLSSFCFRLLRSTTSRMKLLNRCACHGDAY
jgi:hypothetical protein